MSNQARADRIAAEQKLIAGVQKHLAELPSVSVAGQTLAPADIVKVLQERIATGESSIAADTARAAASQADKDELAKTAAIVSTARKLIQVMFSNNPASLADFGIKPPTVTTPSAATKVAAVAKRAATRAARHTMGPKQKAAIHGTVAAAPSTTTPAAPAKS